MRGFSLSLVFHLALLAAGLIYLPKAAERFDLPVIIPVELVTLADTVSVRAAAPEPEEVPEEAIEEETIEDEIVDPVVAPEPEPEPEPEVEIIPEEPTTDPEPEPEPEEVAPEPEPVVEEPLFEEPVQSEPALPSFDDLLDQASGMVDEIEAENDADQGDRISQSVGAGDVNTATLDALINQHLRSCWRESMDMPNPEEMAVPIELTLNRDGTLAQPPRIVNQGQYLNSPNPFLRVAAERALRAAVECEPYPLPVDQYNEWRQITATFRPRS